MQLYKQQALLPLRTIITFQQHKLKTTTFNLSVTYLPSLLLNLPPCTSILSSTTFKIYTSRIGARPPIPSTVLNEYFISSPLLPPPAPFVPTSPPLPTSVLYKNCSTSDSSDADVATSNSSPLSLSPSSSLLVLWFGAVLSGSSMAVAF